MNKISAGTTNEPPAQMAEPQEAYGIGRGTAQGILQRQLGVTAAAIVPDGAAVGGEIIASETMKSRAGPILAFNATFSTRRSI